MSGRRVALPMVGAVTAAIAASACCLVPAAGSSEAEAKVTLHLKVTGMDCKECTGTIANRIKKVPGVVSATVDFESGAAIVRHDGRDGIESAAINAVEAAGFHAEVQR